MVTFHHSIADKISGVMVVRDLLQSLAGHTLADFEQTESIDGLLGGALQTAIAGEAAP